MTRVKPKTSYNENINSPLPATIVVFRANETRHSCHQRETQSCLVPVIRDEMLLFSFSHMHNYSISPFLYWVEVKCSFLLKQTVLLYGKILFP